MTEEERQKYMSHLYGMLQQMHKTFKILELHPEYYIAMSMTEAAAHDFYGKKPYTSAKELSEVLNGTKGAKA